MLGPPLLSMITLPAPASTFFTVICSPTVPGLGKLTVRLDAPVVTSAKSLALEAYGELDTATGTGTAMLASEIAALRFARVSAVCAPQEVVEGVEVQVTV